MCSLREAPVQAGSCGVTTSSTGNLPAYLCSHSGRQRRQSARTGPQRHLLLSIVSVSHRVCKSRHAPLLSLRFGGGKSSMFTVDGATKVAGKLWSVFALATNALYPWLTAATTLRSTAWRGTGVPHEPQRCKQGSLVAGDWNALAHTRTQALKCAMTQCTQAHRLKDPGRRASRVGCVTGGGALTWIQTRRRRPPPTR